MDSPLSVNFYTNSTWVVCFQLFFPQIQHGQSTFSHLLQNSNMDGSLSINLAKNSTGSFCFQSISPHIQHGLPPFSWLLCNFKMGKLSAFNYLFHKSNLDTLLQKFNMGSLLSIKLCTNPTRKFEFHYILHEIQNWQTQYWVMRSGVSAVRSLHAQN